MIHRRGVLPVLALLALVVIGAVLQIVGGPAASAPPARPSPTPPPVTGAARQVLASLAAVERAYDRGNVVRLCRPGALIDPAVIRAQNGCESELERMMANVPRLQVTVGALTVRPDLVTVAVTPAGGGAATVDFVRRGHRWLLSFSDGNDPMPALIGAI